jgi:translocator protein
LDWSLAVFFVLVVATASSGVFFKPGDWYRKLSKPTWTPPNWVFGPVWSVLYIMIAIAGWLVWRDGQPGLALGLWVAQLLLNAAWSGLFFGMRRMDLALYDIALMWLAVAGFIIAASLISTVAAWLFVPYLIWVTIAGTLNWSVLRLNSEQI